MRCTLGRAQINGKALLEMKVDDVIRLDKSVGDPVMVDIEGVPKLKGYMGSFRNKRAVRISEFISKE
jgi:flagellar motor switch protein FliM